MAGVKKLKPGAKVRKTICTTCFTFNPGRSSCSLAEDGRHVRRRWWFTEEK